MSKVKRQPADTADDQYKQIKNSVIELSRKKEFEVLVNWWASEYTKLDEEIGKAKPGEIFLLVKEREIIKKHLLWLEAMQQEIR